MGEKREKAIKFFQDMQECTYGNLEEVDMAIHALEQERNVIEELEKIKEELIYATDVDYDEKTMRFFIGAEDIDRIFGKYINELKGENK